MSKFSPASFGAGFGAGSTEARGLANGEIANIRVEAEIAATRAATAATNQSSHDRSMLAGAEGMANMAIKRMQKAEGEIKNRWIPYAVTLNASLVARRVEREDLIAALKKADPANADNIITQAAEHRQTEYRSFEGEKYSAAQQEVMSQSEAERLDK